MKTLLKTAKRYVKKMDLHDVALLKICLLSLGFIASFFVPLKARKPLFTASIFAFFGTCVTLMSDFFRIWHVTDHKARRRRREGQGRGSGMGREKRKA